jgi:RecB family exonuclease
VTRAVALLTEAERHLERDVVIGLLGDGVSASSPIMFGLDGVAADRRLPVGEFDRCSRAAGVVAGITEWRSRLGAYGRRSPERCESGTSPEGARGLLGFVERLYQLGARLDAARSWVDAASWAVVLAEKLLEPSERRVALAEALGGLAALGEIEELGPPGSDDRARQIGSAFAAALRRTAGPVGRFGAGPTFGTVSELAGMRTELLVVVGMTEGALPARNPDDPLVTELERRSAASLLDIERTEDRDRRNLVTLLAGAERAVALFPRIDRSGSRLAHPSRWLDRDLFSGQVEAVPSHAGALAQVADGTRAAADGGDLELAALWLAARHRVDPTTLFVADLDDLSGRLRAEGERRAPLSRFSGNAGSVSGHEGVLAGVMSATAMEQLAKCPLQFFFERFARVSRLDAPERRHTIEPMDRGSLIHSVLEDFVSETALSGERAFSGWDGADLVRLREIAESYCDEFESRGLTGKPVYWKMERAGIVRDLERYIAFDNEWLREGDEAPIRAEMSFGRDDEEPVVIDAGGRQIRFRGKIDRVDRAGDGSVRVIDYKSGRANHFRTIESNPLGNGRHLQLPIYAKAAQALAGEGGAVTAEFRFCSAAGGFSRVSVALTPELESELTGTLGVLAGIAANGTLPPRPGKAEYWGPEHCRYCSFDAACRLDRSDAWERAARTPAMSAYADLVDADSNGAGGVA